MIVKNNFFKNYFTNLKQYNKNLKKTKNFLNDFLLDLKDKQIPLLKSYEKKNASKIYKLILKNKKKLINKKISISFVKRKIFEYGARKIDYIEILNINKLIKPFKRKKIFKIFIAYYMGNTRLIDNI